MSGDNEDNVRQSRLAMVNFSERVWMGKLCITVSLHWEVHLVLALFFYKSLQDPL